MALIIREGSSDSHDDPKQADKFKVGLGLVHTCTCGTYMNKKESCVHIFWVLLKLFGIPRDSELLYQDSLVEREIAEIMQSRNRRRPTIVTPPTKPSTGPPAPGKTPTVEKRPIEPDDVCPICQEDLLTPGMPLTYCKTSCGNSIHIKCVKVLMEHQTKTMGLDKIKCPLCRNDLGSVDELQREFAQVQSRKMPRGSDARKTAVHK
ncbi:E3 ubiquitin-protein ligase Zswim2, partial [Borealophlyctis nickersoniae]